MAVRGQDTLRLLWSASLWVGRDVAYYSVLAVSGAAAFLVASVIYHFPAVSGTVIEAVIAILIATVGYRLVRPTFGTTKLLDAALRELREPEFEAGWRYKAATEFYHNRPFRDEFGRQGLYNLRDLIAVVRELVTQIDRLRQIESERPDLSELAKSIRTLSDHVIPSFLNETMPEFTAQMRSVEQTIERLQSLIQAAQLSERESHQATLDKLNQAAAQMAKLGSELIEVAQRIKDPGPKN